MKNLANQKGFTLIEVLVVITMLGILSTIIVPQITKQLEKPKKSRAMIEIKTLKNALDMYYAENNAYPATKADINSLMKEEGVLAGKYGTASASDPWGNPYYIKADSTTYTIWSEGPDTGNQADDLYTDNTKTDITVSTSNLDTATATTNSKDNT